ncbi:hypothetical protein IW146_008088 [Coemansia sp. RSA 922]|nr:hypothetical protein GGI14_002701 [Coemansia sp. S680]KAJ2105754.1 hypothetical protein IW146_008088 [Coemansia sp. RSA 922]
MNSYIEEQWNSTKLEFNPWSYSRAEKQGILLAIFKATHVLTVLELLPSDMLDFCLDIESLYNDVPYHSFNHAVDVVVKLYYVLSDLQASAYLASYDIASLLIAGLCHDCGHPGLNNLFQRNASTELAQRYPDAILERYSMDLTTEYINKHDLLRNIKNLRDPMYSDGTTAEVDVASRMMYSIRTAILSTDMSRHFSLVEECKVLVSLLSKKARRISEHEAYQKECQAEASATPAEASSGNGKETAAQLSPGATNSPSRLSLAKSVLRGRSPSEPATPLKSLFSYSLQSAKVSPLRSESRKESSTDSSTTSSPKPATTTSTSTSTSATNGAKNGKPRRMQVRRSVSMYDALLDSTQRQRLIGILLHAVDVFNPVLPWPMCKKWSDLMNIESFNQGETEKKLSLPVSPNMDRTTTDQRQVSLDFGNIIIRPFFSELVSLFPVDDELLPALESNLQKWSRMSTDNTHEISAPAGANNNMYSWPAEPVITPVSRTNSSVFSEDRRLSVAAGTVDIPSSCLEIIRRHSHAGFEALHRPMVGRLFSKHLGKVQERRKVSYTSLQQRALHLDTSSGTRLSGGGAGSTLQLSPSNSRQWRGFDAESLSPVKESSGHEDSSVPSSAVADSSPPTAFAASGLPANPPLTVSTARFPLAGCGALGGTRESASSARASVFAASSRHQSPTTAQLSNYRIDSLISGSGRAYRSSSLDPTMLSSMPSSYPSLSGDASGPASSEVSDKA